MCNAYSTSQFHNEREELEIHVLTFYLYTAMIVGCLPSFAVFIHGRVAASRAQYESGSNKNPASPRTKSRGTAGSNRLWQFHDTASDKSLVGGGIPITQSGRQSWHNTTGQKVERLEGLETDHELEIVGGNNGNGK